MKRMSGPAIAGLLLGGCGAIGSAHMVIPSDLAAAPPIRIGSIGHGNRGDFRVTEYAGSYTRSEERLAFFDTVEQRSGHTDFTLQGPAGPPIEAECRMRERNVQIGIVGFTPQRMAYRCAFGGGNLLPIRFELQEARQPVETLKRERRGEILFGDTRLTIRSAHRLQGTVIDTPAPIGYIFERDGRVVAALDLNGAAVIRLADQGDGELRKAVLTASVALALFRDPANSSLGELGDD
ncbi:hypothetical protein [Sphingosinithalassobacter portus]|uniref:hypothetical protein n=1 Tax=Stakelama portus TaxID=2676234 RepID=UPI000D6E4DE1|nr:hypothetical protein [Sphingosinithalassobacter portus]